MTGGLSSILQPLSNDLSPRKPPELPHHRAHITATTTAILPHAASGPRIVPVAFSSSTSSRAPEYTHTRHNRLSLAAIAREKTTAALANLSLHPKSSSQSLYSASSSLGGVSKSSHVVGDKRSIDPNHPTGQPGHPEEVVVDHTQSAPSVSENSREKPQAVVTTAPRASPSSRGRDIPSCPEVSISPDAHEVQVQASNRAPAPAHAHAPASRNKMHQTSSRLLRMTDEERPFTRDFEDLFSTLMVSLPLSTHRIRFQKIEHTFTSEEAINNLGSLKFSQSNRMPDPKDPTRIVTTTTTTTFSMAKEMARSVCQRFMDARFIETADGKPLGVFPLKNAVWQLTPKGMHVLTRFCQRNGINQRHVLEVLDSYRNTMQLVILEREGTTDKLSHDRATIEVIFRRFAGQDGPNVKLSITTSDSDSLSDYYNGLIGVKMAKERKILDRVVSNTFTGKAAVDWLMDCCTTVDRREVYEIADLFVHHGLIWAVVEDKIYANQNPAATRFQPTKNGIYALTEKGQRVAGWLAREDSTSSDDARSDTPKSNKGAKPGKHAPRDSNNHRLTIIVNDPALRLLFREFLRDTHCEENLAFYLEVRDFTRSYDTAERAKAFTRLDAIRESLAAAYGLYNAFLAPGSPCELNIDHNLRNSLAGRMTRAVGDDDSMLKSLQEVVGLFRDAQASVFKLMSSDSVPKFLREPKYTGVLSQHNFDNAPSANHAASSAALPERSRSKVVRDGRVS